MSKLRAWSGKYVTRLEGDTMWVRADSLANFRDVLVGMGRTETGETLVTGGKTYHAFVLTSLR